MRYLIDLVERAAAGGSPLNSLGKPIAHSPEALNNFWAWFGRSKVVDPSGKPLVLFHGTKADFRSFDPGLSKKKFAHFDIPSAYFFTLSPEVAQSYAGQTTHPHWMSDEDHDEHLKLMGAGRYDDARKMSAKKGIKNFKTWNHGANVMPVYLRMLKPLRASGKGNYWNEIWFDGDFVDTRDLLMIAQEKGYDGLIIKNVHDRADGKGKPSTIFAVLHPNQIKSAVTNTGSYGSHDLIDETAKTV